MQRKNQTQTLPTANTPLDIQKTPKKYLVTNHPSNPWLEYGRWKD